MHMYNGVNHKLKYIPLATKLKHIPVPMTKKFNTVKQNCLNSGYIHNIIYE